jgi:hypothetical protein
MGGGTSVPLIVSLDANRRSDPFRRYRKIHDPAETRCPRQEATERSSVNRPKPVAGRPDDGVRRLPFRGLVEGSEKVYPRSL